MTIFAANLAQKIFREIKEISEFKEGSGTVKVLRGIEPLELCSTLLNLTNLLKFPIIFRAIPLLTDGAKSGARLITEMTKNSNGLTPLMAYNNSALFLATLRSACKSSRGPNAHADFSIALSY